MTTHFTRISELNKGSFNIYHPELEDGEMFVLNCHKDDFKNVVYRTKRLGSQAYTRSGDLVSKDVLLPVFAKIFELEFMSIEDV
jgi:hypothetical protein